MQTALDCSCILFTLEIFQEESKQIQNNIKGLVINHIKNKKIGREGERIGPPVGRDRC
jgi:hypothetical protein